jgi:hypothetical protein
MSPAIDGARRRKDAQRHALRLLAFYTSSAARRIRVSYRFLSGAAELGACTGGAAGATDGALVARFAS